MSRARWTNHEVRRLQALFEVTLRPSSAVLADAIPRHPPQASRKMARQYGLLKPKQCRVPAERSIHWMRVAHEHFARRESGMLT